MNDDNSENTYKIAILKYTKDLILNCERYRVIRDNFHQYNNQATLVIMQGAGTTIKTSIGMLHNPDLNSIIQRAFTRVVGLSWVYKMD